MTAQSREQDLKQPVEPGNPTESPLQRALHTKMPRRQALRTIAGVVVGASFFDHGKSLAHAQKGVEQLDPQQPFVEVRIEPDSFATRNIPQIGYSETIFNNQSTQERMNDAFWSAFGTMWAAQQTLLNGDFVGRLGENNGFLTVPVKEIAREKLAVAPIEARFIPVFTGEDSMMLCDPAAGAAITYKLHSENDDDMQKDPDVTFSVGDNYRLQIDINTTPFDPSSLPFVPENDARDIFYTMQIANALDILSTVFGNMEWWNKYMKQSSYDVIRGGSPELPNRVIRVDIAEKLLGQALSTKSNGTETSYWSGPAVLDVKSS